MRRALAVILVIFLGACAAEPPERATLPDLAEVLDEPVGCQLSVGEPRGVAIVSVIEPSAASGILEEGDVITEVDGVATVTRSDLTDIMAGHSPEDVVEFGFIRDGEAETATITLGANPNEPSRAMIGITIETAFDQIAPDQADDVVAPSDTARPIHIGETLLLFDPLRNTWQQTGIVPPADTRWVSTSTGIYSVEGEDDVSIVDLMSGETIEDDGYQGWEEHAPYDGIMVTAAPDHVPQALIAQLKPGGRLVIPVGGLFQDLMVIAKAADGTTTSTSIIPVRFVPLVRK